MKKALIVIDLQEAFFEIEENNLYNAEKIINNINTIIDKHRSLNNLIIFVQHTSNEEKDEFYRGSSTWKLYKGLHYNKSDTIIQKESWDAFLNTGLKNILEENRILKLHFVGAQTEYCLDTTLRNAYSLGYKNNYIYRNAHTTIDSKILKAEQIIEHHENIWDNRFCKIIENE
jgi:nicotinamidase-related amidase